MSSQTLLQDYIFVQPQSGALLDALRHYHAGDYSKAELKAVIGNYEEWKAEVAQMSLPQLSWTQTIQNVLSSFSLFPSERYEFIVPPHIPQSGIEAIESHWRAAGEHLSYALIRHILEEGDEEANGEY